MRDALVVLVIAGLNSVMAVVVFSRGAIKDPVVVFALSLLFVVPNIGTIWMLYISIRFERRPLPFVLLAFIPYAFLWYYFQRVRCKKHLTKEVHA
jgi:hypothetical protein